MAATLPSLVSCKRLFGAISAQYQANFQRSTSIPGQGTLKILDASWYLPSANRNPRKEFEARRIPTARFFDLDEVSDKSSSLPHMLPSPNQFEEAMSELGVNNADHVVVYDASDPGLFSAARLWWTLRVFGHRNVSVLDGGLQQWKRDGFALETFSPRKPDPGNFKADFQNDLVCNKAFILNHLMQKHPMDIVDARPSSRFFGQEGEPRPGLRRGHIPGAHSLPFSAVLDPTTKLLKSPKEIEAVFQQAGILLRGKNTVSPLIAMCGSGVTACVLAFAAHVVDESKRVAVYDGSWAEWGACDNGLPVVSNDDERRQ